MILDWSYRKIGILGNGLMASGIARVSLEFNYDVIMKGRSTVALEDGRNKVAESFDESVKRMKITK